MSSEQSCKPHQQQGEVKLGSDTREDEQAAESGMVTSKGAGLNPNAKVWQEIPAAPGEALANGSEGSHWPEATASPLSVSEGFLEVPPTGCKANSIGFAGFVDDCSHEASESTVNGMDSPDVCFSTCDATGVTAVEGEVLGKQNLTEENLRESLKKHLEFCFSRENLSKDLYLMSQMDSDQFVPIWTIASMEGIKSLTTDMDLILDVLKSSPMVQVDEKGEKVRPNRKRCIIILREVPETTPVEEVEALFKNDDCPKVISVEFAHNNNWYITFQSDTDAQQAYRYLREEVKTFQGKPIMARIKAINTFFAKNGYHNLDSSVYTQQSQSQAPYSPPLFMQQVYSPQQQYPVYGIVPPTWTPSPTPYFETPLAPFPNSGFVNGFGTHAHYKASSISPIGRAFSRTRVPLYSRKNEINAFRNHVKPQVRNSDGPSSAVSAAPLVEGHLGSRTVAAALSPSELSSSCGLRDAHLSPLEPSEDAGRGRRTTYRGTRRRRDDDRTMRTLPLSEVKVPAPKFDLAASNFPPLPGCVVSPQGEPMLENRMSDVVRGLNREKQQDVSKECPVNSSSGSEEAISVPSSGHPVCRAALPTADPPLSIPRLPFYSANYSEKKVEKAEIPAQREMHRTPGTVSALPAPTQTGSISKTPPCSPAPVAATSVSLASPSSSVPEPRKLSYAEVCQRPPKDPPSSVASPATLGATSYPLRELRVNKAEDPVSAGSGTSDKPEKNLLERGGEGKACEGRPFRDCQGLYKGHGGFRAGSAGLKVRDQQRRPPPTRRSSPQGGPRHIGKEQNIPPRSAK